MIKKIMNKSESYDKGLVRILSIVLGFLLALLVLVWVLGKARARRTGDIASSENKMTTSETSSTNSSGIKTTEPFKISSEPNSKIYIEIDNGSKPQESRILVRMEVTPQYKKMIVYKGYEKTVESTYDLTNNKEAYERLLANLEVNGSYGFMRDDGLNLKRDTYCPENRHYLYGFATATMDRSFARAYAACDDLHYGNTNGKVVRYGDFGGDTAKSYRLIREQFPDYTKYDKYLGL